MLLKYERISSQRIETVINPKKKGSKLSVAECPIVVHATLPPTVANQTNFLMIHFLGLFMLTLGINEFRRERKLYGWFLVGVFIFSVYVSIQSFVLLV